MPVGVSRDQVVRYRARVSHLDRKLPPGAYATAAWGGLQDSVPRGGVIALHARVEGTTPDAWEDPSLAQIWFRGGADYLVPRADVGIFSLGSYPRDPDEATRLEHLADAVHRVTQGEILKVREVSALLGHDHPTAVRFVALTGRAHIRWDASNIWLIPVERPEIDAEDARRELARRFVHWYAPTTERRMTFWTGAKPRDAAETWRAIEPELVPVEIDDVEGTRFALAADIDALRAAAPVGGVRLVPFDDAFSKLDTDLLVRDDALRANVLPAWGEGPGYIPGAVLVDGEVIGAWERRQRKVTIHPFTAVPAHVRDAIEAEALAFPIAGASKPSVAWAEAGKR